MLEISEGVFEDVLILRGVKVNRDVFGRIYFDECEDDLQHLTKPAEDGVRTHCRKDINRLFEDVVGKRGKFVLVARFVEEP